MPLPSGHTVTADEFDLYTRPGEVLARTERSSDKAFTGTEVGVLRLDNISLTSGRLYLISTSSVRMGGTAGESGVLSLRIDTTGSAATTSSTVIGTYEGTFVTNAFIGAITDGVAAAYYAPSSDVTLSVLLTVSRSGGSNNITVQAGTRKFYMWVSDVGVDPGNTGVVI